MEYWNHNTAYHSDILRIARDVGGRGLDVGCGDGLLVQRLAPWCAEVVGLEPDAAVRQRAAERIESVPNARILGCDFESAPLQDRGFNLVTLVASLHHVELAAGLRRARALLRPGGTLFVVGLATNRTASDWILAGLQLPLVWLMDRRRRKRDPQVPLAEPRESLGDIRRVAAEILPGCRIRRRLYYRYTLTWTSAG